MDQLLGAEMTTLLPVTGLLLSMIEWLNRQRWFYLQYISHNSTISDSGDNSTISDSLLKFEGVDC